MRRLDFGLLNWWLCLMIILVPLCAPADNQDRYGQDCNLDIVDDTCGPNGRCKQENNKTGAKCTCQQGYAYINKKCNMLITKVTKLIPFTSDSISSRSDRGNSVLVVLLPTCLIIIGALSYGARRFKWVQRFHQFRQNRYGSVLVTRDDTDDDDPPIA